jgi:hypothetical protein
LTGIGAILFSKLISTSRENAGQIDDRAKVVHAPLEVTARGNGQDVSRLGVHSSAMPPKA